MKLIFTLVFVYLAYRFFFDRPRIRPPYRPSQETPRQQGPRQASQKAQDSDEYVDYEEVE
jgi:hypothetical protein